MLRPRDIRRERSAKRVEVATARASRLLRTAVEAITRGTHPHRPLGKQD